MSLSLLTLKKMVMVVAMGVSLEIPVVAPPPEEMTCPWEEHLTQNELDMFAQLIMAESGNQDMNGKRLAADVVINRVNSDRFPDTIEEVIYQNNQFTCVKSGLYDRCKKKVTKECYDAIKLEYTSLKLNDGILYFSSTEKSANGTNEFKYQDHWFAY